MSDNFNDQFERWNKDENENTVPDDECADDEAVEQVSLDLFGFTAVQEPGGESARPPDSAAQVKTSFAELRHGRKVPRLKKTMVLTLIAGGTFVFLFVINLFLQKKNAEKKYFDEQRNAVTVGSNFSVDDLLRRQGSPEEDENDLIIEDAGFYFQIPPPYEPLPAYRAAAAPPPVYNAGGSYYSDSDLLAMRAQIAKDGGYGFFTQAAAYDTGTRPGNGEYFPTREEYTRQRIDEIARLTQPLGLDTRTNDDRLNNGRYTDAGAYNPNNTQAGSGVNYLNDACLFPGTIIHAILVSRIDTDYPGPIHARVTENVYDSMTGKNLLVPQGTILQGNYSSSSVGVAKVQIAWESMVVNHAGVAYQVSLGGMAGVDKRGRSGIAGTLDDHYFEWLKAAGIISLFSIINSEMTYQTGGQTSPQARDLIDINQGIVNRLGDRLMERALNIQPTVRIANGTELSVAVNTPLALQPFPAVQAEGKYIRR